MKASKRITIILIGLFILIGCGPKNIWVTSEIVDKTFLEEQVTKTSLQPRTVFTTSFVDGKIVNATLIVTDTIYYTENEMVYRVYYKDTYLDGTIKEYSKNVKESTYNEVEIGQIITNEKAIDQLTK